MVKSWRRWGEFQCASHHCDGKYGLPSIFASRDTHHTTEMAHVHNPASLCSETYKPTHILLDLHLTTLITFGQSSKLTPNTHHTIWTFVQSRILTFIENTPCYSDGTRAKFSKLAFTRLVSWCMYTVNYINIHRPKGTRVLSWAGLQSLGNRMHHIMLHSFVTVVMWCDHICPFIMAPFTPYINVFKQPSKTINS